MWDKDGLQLAAVGRAGSAFGSCLLPQPRFGYTVQEPGFRRKEGRLVGWKGRNVDWSYDLWQHHRLSQVGGQHDCFVRGLFGVTQRFSALLATALNLSRARSIPIQALTRRCVCLVERACCSRWMSYGR